MKKTIKTVVAVVLIGVAAPVLSQPTNADTGDNQGGRYRLVPVNQGSYSTPYVIDTQTGRVWREVVDSENKILIFVSMNYRNIDGELSKVPNEAATGVFLKSKSGQNAEPKTGNDVKQPVEEKTDDNTKKPFQQKMDDDMKKLFPNATRGGNTNSP